ncbi:MAG: hypothetical protein ACI8TF_002870 [Paracoccaceae bacterium]|jgi:hypothetical protein
MDEAVDGRDGHGLEVEGCQCFSRGELRLVQMAPNAAHVPLCQFKFRQNGKEGSGWPAFCIGRKNWLFAGADTGAETLARTMTIIETAKLNGLDPQAYLADILDRIQDHKINRRDNLLPWNWAPIAVQNSQAA